MTATTPTFDEFQKFSKEQLEAFTFGFDHAVEGIAGYRHRVDRLFEEGVRRRLLAMFEKLLGARSVESAVQIQTEFAKQAYEGFVAQATKVSENSTPEWPPTR